MIHFLSLYFTWLRCGCEFCKKRVTDEAKKIRGVR